MQTTTPHSGQESADDNEHTPFPYCQTLACLLDPFLEAASAQDLTKTLHSKSPLPSCLSRPAWWVAPQGEAWQKMKRAPPMRERLEICGVCELIRSQCRLEREWRNLVVSDLFLQSVK